MSTNGLSQNGYGTLEEMEIGAQSSQSIDVTVSVAGVTEQLGRAMMEDIASNQGLLATETRSTVAARLPLLKMSPDHIFSFEAEMMTKCTLTSDVQKLPEFAHRRCSSSSSAHYMLSD
mmetsp:Transcript_30516/g.61436  ORF Transcript_30516/g.61436 Transcript_30516/m.61436 type:complete len:118 (+) Transcript_30516:1-354(+)